MFLTLFFLFILLNRPHILFLFLLISTNDHSNIETLIDQAVKNKYRRLKPQ